MSNNPNVRRYSIDWNMADERYEINARNDGEYVLHTDYATLLAERDELKELLKHKGYLDEVWKRNDEIKKLKVDRDRMLKVLEDIARDEGYDECRMNHSFKARECLTPPEDQKGKKEHT